MSKKRVTGSLTITMPVDWPGGIVKKGGERTGTSMKGVCELYEGWSVYAGSGGKVLHARRVEGPDGEGPRKEGGNHSVP